MSNEDPITVGAWRRVSGVGVSEGGRTHPAACLPVVLWWVRRDPGRATTRRDRSLPHGQCRVSVSAATREPVTTILVPGVVEVG